jgi:hypothetical protein
VPLPTPGYTAQAEEAARRSEGEAKRLAQENAFIAEISRIISSTLNIEEVYERFGEEVRKLIPFDRIAINLIDPKNYTLSISYVLGSQTFHRQLGDSSPSQSTEEFKIRSTFCQVIMDRLQRDTGAGSFWTRYQSIIMALLSRRGGNRVFNIQPKTDAYDEMDLKLIERVSIQISGPVMPSSLPSAGGR